MISRSTLLTSLVLLGLAACTNDRTSPAAPNIGESARFDGPSAFDPADGDGDDDDVSDFQRLVAITGPGHGRFRATRIAHPTTPGNFAIHIEARVRGAKPNTSYLVQRAPDTFSPPGPPAGFAVSTLTDGSCQRALALPPWTTLVPAPAAFVSWVPTVTTDERGDGETDFVFALPFPLPAFDVMFRLLEVGVAPRSVLVTDCITLPV